MSLTRKSGGGAHFNDHHPLQHWYRDNQVYFITARCRDRYPAFASVQAKQVFWDRFDHYTAHFSFVPWVTSLIDNHYHTLGYLNLGQNLGPMMRRIHGSIAKLVNDLLPQRCLPFWRDSRHHDYFDGCIRDEQQARKAYHYTLTQSQRHGIVVDWRDYPHTHVHVDLERAIRRANELNAYLRGVPYRRYRNPHR